MSLRRLFVRDRTPQVSNEGVEDSLPMAHPDAEWVGFGTKPCLWFERCATERNALCNRERTHPGALRSLSPPATPPRRGFSKELFMPRCGPRSMKVFVIVLGHWARHKPTRGRVRRRGRFQGSARLRDLWVPARLTSLRGRVPNDYFGGLKLRIVSTISTSTRRFLARASGVLAVTRGLLFP
jgi:hypothetical protein